MRERSEVEQKMLEELEKAIPVQENRVNALMAAVAYGATPYIMSYFDGKYEESQIISRERGILIAMINAKERLQSISRPVIDHDFSIPREDILPGSPLWERVFGRSVAGVKR